MPDPLIIDGIVIPDAVVRGAFRRVVIHDDPCAQFEVEGRMFDAIEIYPHWAPEERSS